MSHTVVRAYFRQPERPRSRVCIFYFFVVSLCLLLALNIILLVLLWSRNAEISGSLPTRQYSYVGEDYPTWYDISAGEVEMTFEESVHYPLEGHVAEVQWDSLWRVDSHKGYIRLGPDRRVFAVAMFHELHCVGSLRRALTNPSHPDAAPHHVHHCFNYLRQFFLCSADSTLEPYDFMTRDYTMERVGITRKCRDWNAVFQAAQQNFIDWRPWFIRNLTSALQGSSE